MSDKWTVGDGGRESDESDGGGLLRMTSDCGSSVGFHVGVRYRSRRTAWVILEFISSVPLSSCTMTYRCLWGHRFMKLPGICLTIFIGIRSRLLELVELQSNKGV
ncbi:hypothetical protein SLA2020_049500 [Shorea laevis]